MSSRPVLTLFLILVPSAILATEPATDREGEPLPEDAVARFGNPRLLHGRVEHVEFSPDGKSLATSGGQGAQLWDVATGKATGLAHLPTTGDAVLTFTPDGSHVVGDARSCRVIEPRTDKVRCSWWHLDKRPNAVVVAADGKSAVTAWAEGGVTVHDLTGGGNREGRTISNEDTHTLSLSGDGKLLAFAAGKGLYEKSIELWDVQEGRLLHTYPAGVAKGAWILTLCLSRDGRRLAASWGDNLRLWDTASHEEVKGFVGPAVEAGFLRFSADGKELVGLAFRHRQLARWSAETGKELALARPPDEKKYQSLLCALSPDGRTVAVVKDGVIRLWDAAWKELVPVQRWLGWYGAAFVQPGAVATFTGERTKEVIALWEVNNGRLLREHRLALPEDEGRSHRALSPDGTLFAAGNKLGVRVYEVESGKQVGRFVPPEARRGGGRSFAFSPDGSRLLSTGDPEELLLWDVVDGRFLRPLEGIPLGPVAFAPDGRTVASASRDRLVLTEVAGGKARHRLHLRETEGRERDWSGTDAIRFSRDGRTVAALAGRAVHVFSTTDGKPIASIYLGGSTGLETVTGALSPDGRWLSHADDRDCEVSVRDLRSPRAASECQTLSGHAAGVTALEFSPDGKYLVSCSADGTALVWDVKRLTGKPKVPVLDTDEAGAWWEMLADTDTARAGRAMAVLVGVPDATVSLLKARLKPAEAPNADRIDRLIADLDNDTFAVREKAFDELIRLAEQAAPTLRKVLEGKPSAQVVRLGRQVLAEVNGPLKTPSHLRQLRAVELLERIGTPAAREVLESLANGGPAARLTQEAKNTLRRWPTP